MKHSLKQMFNWYKDCHTSRNDCFIVQRLLLLLILTYLSIPAFTKVPAPESNYQASFVLSGTVFDEKSVPLPGVSINIVGTSLGAMTDILGKFLLEVESPNDSIIVSFIGYKSFVTRVGDLNRTKNVIIKLELDEVGRKLNEVVVVGFATQKKQLVTGAISTVKISELQQASTPSLSNAIGGKLPGIITRQVSGEPGYDAANVFIRGFETFTGVRTPLILIDGVERSMDNINVQEVESFSVLKDATATAVYGIRGANGVILINTKRGVAGTPKISFRTESAMLTPLRLPNFINSYEYGILCNEATSRGGAVNPYFTDEQLQKYKDHSDPYLYPDVDWVDVVLKKNTFQTINNLSLNGGNQTFKYFTNVGYTVQQGIYKEDSDVPYATNTSYKRFNFRSNVDVNLSKTLSMSLNLGGITSNGNYPGTSAFMIMEAMNLTPNNAFPLKNPDGSVPGKSGFLLESPYMKTTQRGYVKEAKSTIQSSLGVKWDLSSITKGLYVKGLFAYDYLSVQGNGRGKQPSTYQYLGKNAEGVDQYKLIQTETALGYSWYSVANRAYYLEASANYDRTFGLHTVSGLLLGNRREYINLTAGSSIENIPFRRQGLAARITYSYDNRYIVEFDGGYNGSENFPPGKRYGFFPSAAVGWIASNESFWNRNVINYLKFRGSYGQVGNDQIGGNARFLFQTTMNKNAANYRFGSGQTYMTGAFAEARLGNEDVTWEVANKTNIGMDMELWNNRILLTLEVFKTHRTDILLSRQTIPSSAGYPGAVIPYANLGAVDNKGIEGSLEFRNKTASGFYYSVQGNFTYAKNKILEDDSPVKPYEYQNSRGQSIDRPYGYIALGLFKDQHEIDNSPSQTFLQTIVRPGDIMYKDLNGDNKIDAGDETFIGYARTPELMYGFGGTVSYKGFDASIFFSGAARTSFFMNGRSMWAFADGLASYNVFREYYDNRWVPSKDNTNAVYPAALDTKASNNFTNNTQYMKNGNYLRLKTAEIGYNFPRKLLDKIRINNIRVFVNGINLAIWDHIKIINPEDNSANENYPLQRNINLGAQITF